jgi:hypothetical protein
MIKLGRFDLTPALRGVAAVAVIAQTGFVNIPVAIGTVAVFDRTIPDVGG